MGTEEAPYCLAFELNRKSLPVSIVLEVTSLFHHSPHIYLVFPPKVFSL